VIYDLQRSKFAYFANQKIKLTQKHMSTIIFLSLPFFGHGFESRKNLYPMFFNFKTKYVLKLV